MGYKLIYAKTVQNDINAIYEYIAEDDVDRATRYIQELENAILQLATSHHIDGDTQYKELNSMGIKKLIFDNYMVFHKVSDVEQKVEIVRVLHGAMNYKKKIIKEN